MNMKCGSQGCHIEGVTMYFVIFVDNIPCLIRVLV